MEQLFENLKKEQHKILSYILNNDVDKKRGLGLYTGIPGDILFLAQCYSTNKDQAILDRINELLDYCLENLQSGEYIYPIFSAGVAGFGWIVDYLIENDIIDKDSEEILELLDPMLFHEMNSLLGHKNHDLLNGALGIGIYFIKRRKYDYVKVLITYLDDNKIINNDEVLWEVDKKNPDKRVVFDFSLSHGAAGILHFLIKCNDLDISKATCRELIDGILCFYKNNLQDQESIGSYFPNLIDVDSYYLDKKNKVMSRLAWCYGDLGILYTILNAAEAYEDKILEQDTLKKLLITSGRVEQEKTLVYDAGFCHGSSGNAFIYHDLFLKTKLPEFQTATEYWLDKTLSYKKESEEGHSHYVFIGGTNSEELENCDNLLEGLIGIGVTYNYVLNPELPRFKDGLMLA